MQRPLTPLLILLTLSFVSSGNAIDAQNPTTLCERFVSSVDKTHCEDQMKELKPDWYLAGLCQKQEQDKSFYQCLHLSRKMNFSPSQIASCDQPESTDQGRLDCLQQVSIKQPQPAYQPLAPIKRLPSGNMKLKEGY